LDQNSAGLRFGDDALKALTIHPTLGADLCQPVLDSRDPSQIFLNVLLSDVTHWDQLSVAVDDGDAKDAFG